VTWLYFKHSHQKYLTSLSLIVGQKWFERFRQASGLQGKAEECQVNTLIYTMGDKADDDLLSSFGLCDEDQKKHSTVKEKFDSYFVKQQNLIFESN